MEDIGTIAAIDCQRRVTVGSIEVFLPPAEAETALGRVPDFRDSEVMSWGYLTQDEAMRLMVCASNKNDGEADGEELKRLSPGAGVAVFRTLYYRIAAYGE